MEDMIEFDDVLLDDSVLRLSVQYDASGFLESCSSSEQYRILATLCSNESRSTFNPRRQGKQHEGQGVETGNGSACVDESIGGVPVTCYSARLLAFSTTMEEHATPVAMLRQARERRCAAEEEAKRKHEAEAEQQKEEEGLQEAEEYYYDEEGGYYYDMHGYYDADGTYYLFDTAEGDEDEGKERQNAEEETVHERGEVRNSQYMEEQDGVATKDDAKLQNGFVGLEDAPWNSDDPFAVDTHGIGPSLIEGETEKTNFSTTAELRRRRCPSEREWSTTPLMGGVLAVHRAAALLECSLPSADTFLRESGVEPDISVCTKCNSSKDNPYDTNGGAAEDSGKPLEANGLHVLASRRHLHIVYVPNAREESDELKAMVNGPMHAISGGVLISIPLFDTSSVSPTTATIKTPYQFTYESIGDGLFLLDVSAASFADSEAQRLTVSLVFGVSSDPNVLFCASPMYKRLTEYYGLRVADHLEQRPIPLRYSPSLLCRNARDTALAPLIEYDAMTHAWFHAHDREDAARAAWALDEMLFFTNHMESPRLCALREAVAALNTDESAARDSLRLDEATAFARLPHLVPSALSLLAQGYATVSEIAEEESRAAAALRAAHEKALERIASAETRRRLDAQFDFERRLRAVETAAALDVLVEREAAGRARVERDEATGFRDTGLADCVLELRAQGLVAGRSTECGGSEVAAAKAPQERRALRRKLQNNSAAPTTVEFMRAVAGWERLGLGQSDNLKGYRKGSRTLDDKSSSSGIRPMT